MMELSDSPWIDKEYIQRISHRVDRFKWKSATLANCRCFVCGDSEKHMSKARGYFLNDQNHWVYYCHNCNCSHSLSSVLKMFFHDLYQEFIKDKIMKKPEKEMVMTQPASSYTTEQKFSTLKKKPVWIPCHQLPTDHIAIQFLLQRKIPEHWWPKLKFTDNFAHLVRFKETSIDERIVLTIKNEFKSTMGFVGRTISNSPQRYIVHMVEKTKHGYFNMDGINHKKQVRVVEGAFDSMFVSNCIGVGNSNLTKYEPDLFNHSDHVLIFDNEPRNKEMLLMMRKAIWNHHPICIWNEKFSREKDINNMICSGKTEQEIEEYIVNNTFSDLKARLQFQQYCKV